MLSSHSKLQLYRKYNCPDRQTPDIRKWQNVVSCRIQSQIWIIRLVPGRVGISTIIQGIGWILQYSFPNNVEQSISEENQKTTKTSILKLKDNNLLHQVEKVSKNQETRTRLNCLQFSVAFLQWHSLPLSVYCGFLASAILGLMQLQAMVTHFVFLNLKFI